MAEHPLGEAVRQVLRALTAESNDTDAQLLTRFAERGDEEAFEILLARHGPMIWRTCWRVARQAADAEDAFQATFLVLCRKVGSISKRQSLGGWLHRVAYRIALKANSRSAFRPLNEEQDLACDSNPAAGLIQSELRPLLDEALSQLPEKYRVPLVLCFLEGKTRARAAAELGWAEGTLSSRLAQGKELLRTHLLRRGVAPAAGALAALLAEEGASQTLPETLLRATLRVKSLFLLSEAARSASQAVPAVVLAKGALKMMFLTKLRIAAMVLLSIGLLGVGAGLVMQQVLADKPVAGGSPFLAKDEIPRGKADTLSDGPPKAPAPAQQASTRTLRVVVLDPQGKPLAGAHVHADIWTDEKGRRAGPDYGPADVTGDFETNATGVAHIELKRIPHTLTLQAGTRALVPIFTCWNQIDLASGRAFPDEFTFRLEAGVTAGGRVVDEQGKPIAGAKIQVSAMPHAQPAHGGGSTGYSTQLAEGNDAATTDAEGRWRIYNVPSPSNTGLQILVSHPDYVSDELWGEAQNAAGVTAAMLRQGTATVTLTRGVSVRGRVTDAAGKPIKDAIIVRGLSPTFSAPIQFPTDADGRFRLPPLPPRETTLTIIAPGWAPQLRRLKVQAGQPQQELRMEPGKPIQLRIVDGEGKPIPNAYVRIIEWKGVNSLSPNNPNLLKRDTKIPQRADAKGTWEWTWAPGDPLKLQVYANGFVACELEVAGGAPVRTVTLNAEPPVPGTGTAKRREASKHPQIQGKRQNPKETEGMTCGG